MNQKKKGIVVSDKMCKTRVVSVNRRVFHKRYKKVLTRTKRYMVHDNSELSFLGDLVIFCLGRPRSKRKMWDLKSVIKYAC